MDKSVLTVVDAKIDAIDYSGAFNFVGGNNQVNVEAVRQKFEETFTVNEIVDIITFLVTAGAKAKHGVFKDSVKAEEYFSFWKERGMYLNDANVPGQQQVPSNGMTISRAGICFPVLTARLMDKFGRSPDALGTDVPKAFRWPGAACLIPTSDKKRLEAHKNFIKNKWQPLYASGRTFNETFYLKGHNSNIVSDSVRKAFCNTYWKNI